MAAVTTVVDGNIKFREGRKWKNRWCVLKKPSPVADHLQLILYKDVSEACKTGGKAKAIYSVDSFFGLKAEICVDREQHVLAIICLKNVFLLAFELGESMIRFEIKIRQSLGEENQFPVKVVKAPSNSKLPKEQLCLIIHDTKFCLTGQTPPKVFLSWNVEDLRRFVARDGKFIFEAGARCGKGSGLFAILSEQANDIADIINLASTGKLSNCHRKFKNRSSQIELGSHLISPLPSQSQSSSQGHHHYHNQSQQDAPASKAPLQTALPATLNCCHQNQTGSAESEDWSWYKRHSVSVTDHRRISALREKSTSDSRDQMMIAGIYDTPPNHDLEREFRTQPEPLYDHPRAYLDQTLPPPSNDAMLPPTSDYMNNDVVYAKIDLKGKIVGAGNEWMDGKKHDSEQQVGSNSITGLELTNRSELDAAACDATLERLKKQESDLQREMVLLDEMLQSCTSEDKSVEKSDSNNQTIGEAPTIPTLKSDKIETKDPVGKEKITNTYYGLYDELPMPQCSQNKEKNAEECTSPRCAPPSSLLSPRDFEIISGNVCVAKPNFMTRSGAVENRLKSVSDRLNTSMPEGTPLSPLFHAKLNSIPPSSRLNAPLPYVNLSGYDDDGTNHVHLPGSADCLPAVTRGGSFHNLNTSYGGSSAAGDRRPSPWRSHVGSSTSLHLPSAVSSLTNLNQYLHHLDSSPRRLQGRQSLDSATGRLRNQNAADHFKLKQAIEGPSFANAAISSSNQREVLIVRMDSSPDISSKKKDSFTSSIPPPRPVPNDTMKSNKSDIVNILTVDSGEASTNASKEEIYVNLPIVKENSPPPPPLPPKGPALLKRLQTSSSKSSLPSSRMERNKSAVTRYTESHYGYDNEPVLTSLRKEPTVEGPASNYLEMGSPKTEHKYRADTVPKAIPRQLDTVVPKVNKTLVKIPKGRDDYMDMAVADLPPTTLTDNLKYEEDDEIYLDVDETFKHSDLYISERKKGGDAGDEYVSASILPERRESTYIEMAQVPSKSNTVQNLETLQAYVSQKLGGSEMSLNTAATTTTTWSNQAVTVVNPTASSSHPPLPRSFKIRHNSDSGPSKRSSASFDSLASNNASSNGKPGKSPMKVYTRMKASSEKPRSPSPSAADRPAPFTNLMEFTKKMGDGKSTYVNTTVNSDEILVANDFVPLPEPVTKEGFLARLKRRGSRDKGTPEKSSSNVGGSSGKNRSGGLERTLSEHESPKCLRKDEKSPSSSSKLKLGRRRSSSFPNRLSYTESNSENSLVADSSQVTTDSSSSVSSEISKSKPVWRKDHNSHSESSSSLQDNSDDSERSPLLKHGKRNVINSITVLHVHQDSKHSQQAPTSKYSKPIAPPRLASSNGPSLSKTDDEKMIEIFQRQHHHPTSHVHSKSMPESNEDSHYLNYTYTNTSTNTDGLCASSGIIHVHPSSSLNCEGSSSNVTSSQNTAGMATEEYCNMAAMPMPAPNPKPPTTLCVNVGVNTHGTNCPPPPALPPKTKIYQALLSPVYETPPALPVLVSDRSFNSSNTSNTIDDDYLNASSATWKSERDVEEDSLSDQYVELKGVDDDTAADATRVADGRSCLSNINSSSVDSKAGRESIPSTSSSSSKEVISRPSEYTTISIPLGPHTTPTPTNEGDDCEETAIPPSPGSSCILVPSSIVVEQNSISSSSDDHETDTVNGGCCLNPAKSILRPRTGGEYIVIRRIRPPDSSLVSGGACSASLVSPSPSLSQVSDCDTHHHHHKYQAHHDNPRHHHHHHHHHQNQNQHSSSHHHRHHHHHHPSQHQHHQHLNLNQPMSSHTSLSVSSQHTTPQRSPSFSSSTIGTTQSQSSLLHDPWERDSSTSHHQNSSFSSPQHNTLQRSILPSSRDFSNTTLSTPSPSPKGPSNFYSQHIFHTVGSSPRVKKNSTCSTSMSAVTEDENIFFPVDMTYNASSPLPIPTRRPGTSCSDSSSCHHQPVYVNQHFVDMHYSQSSGSRTNSTCSSQFSASPLRSFRQTNRFLLQDSFPFSSNSKHSRDSNSLGRKTRTRLGHSESDAGITRSDRLSKSFTLPSNHHHHRPSLTLPSTSGVHVHRSHSDPKKADHLLPRQSVSQSHILGKEFDKFANSSIIARRRLKHGPSKTDLDSKGESDSPPPIASRVVKTSDSSPNLQSPPANTKSSGYKNIDRLSLSSSSSHPISANISPACRSVDGLTESQSLSSDQQSDSCTISNSPPPLPIRQRLVSTPSTISPPLTPFMGASSDISDSPPPYNAPPPPDFHRSEPDLTPSSSEDEQELNYIEIDMTKKPENQVEEPSLRLSYSRRSKRARQQRTLAKLRYAEIDHTATKALQHTGQEHAQSRRGGGSFLSKSGSSLSRMNSVPTVKNHKPMTVRERKHSTGSVESF